MSNPIGYYTSYNAQKQDPTTLDRIQERFGSQLEQMSYEQKIVFRAALAGFVALNPVYDESQNSITCIDACIECAGVDWNIWEADTELCEWITDCSKLNESDIEGLIEALTSQIRNGVYESRMSDWEVVTTYLAPQQNR